MRPAPNAYEAILDAAETVVSEAGAAHLTLDAVAAKAGVSKGGLLYHFPTKEALIQAMLDRIVGGHEAFWKKKETELRNERASQIKSYILSTLSRDPKVGHRGVALLAGFAHNPKLLEPIRRYHRKVLAEVVSSNLGFERAAVVTLAANGLRLMEILSISPFDARQRKRVMEELLDLADKENLS